MDGQGAWKHIDRWEIVLALLQSAATLANSVRPSRHDERLRFPTSHSPGVWQANLVPCVHYAIPGQASYTHPRGIRPS